MTARGKQMLAQMRRDGAPAPRAFAQLFAAHGIERIYACPGDLCFTLLGACHEEGLEIVTCRTHATAIFAAAADAQAIGALRSLVVVTRAPGVQNAMAAMASTIKNGTPVVLVVPSEDAGIEQTGAFQAWGSGLDSSEQLLVRQINNPATACTEISQALGACTGPARRSGLIEIERAVLGGSTPAAAAPVPQPRPEQTDALPRMAELLQTAKRPVLVVGHLARWTLDLDALAALSARLEAPICPTGLSQGFAGEALDTLSLDQVHEVLAEADAVLLIGAALDWPLRQGVAIAPTTPVLELRDTTDVAPAARAPDHVAVGDLGRMIDRLTDALPLRNTPPVPPCPAPAPVTPVAADRLAPSFRLSAQVLESLAHDFPARAALVVEGSTRLIQLARDIRPDQAWARFTPGLTGHLGCGPGQVLGAMASGRFDQVVYVAGDFSLGLVLGDLETLVRRNLPVKILLANNSGMGSGRALSAGKHTFMVDYNADTDYAQIMRGFGGQGHTLRNMADWPALARQVFDSPTPCLVDIREDV